MNPYTRIKDLEERVENLEENFDALVSEFDAVLAVTTEIIEKLSPKKKKRGRPSKK